MAAARSATMTALQMKPAREDHQAAFEVKIIFFRQFLHAGFVTVRMSFA
jgi:hypothetical protein